MTSCATVADIGRILTGIATGKLLYELRLFEEAARDDIEVPMWWPERVTIR